MSRAKLIGAIAAAAALALSLTAAPPATAATPDLTRSLTKGVKEKGIQRHLEAFQRIADENDGNRAAATKGYEASRDYVAAKLRRAGYKVTLNEVTFPLSWREVTPTVLQQKTPDDKAYEHGTDFVPVGMSGNADVTAEIQTVDPHLPPGEEPNTATSGCEDEDFDGFVAGRIALIQRGTCSFLSKAQRAQRFGAAGVIFFNEGQPGRTDPLSFNIEDWRWGEYPIVFASHGVGVELTEAETVRVKVDGEIEFATDENVIAESRRGDPSKVVMAGAHLDSVPAGPGVNDNGSGSAGLLEVALRAARLPVRNKLRFAWWAAEERGLLGSEAYVAGLSEAERDRIKLYLNFDMIGSPNFVYGIYDGDGSDFGVPGPPGSDEIEKTFERYFTLVRKPSQGSAFTGRSDYGPFIEIGIPAGGLFTGAEGIKTEAEAERFGGEAGVAYDPCYHQECDTISNFDATALRVNTGAVAFAVGTYAWARDLPGGGRTRSTATARTAARPGGEASRQVTSEPWHWS